MPADVVIRGGTVFDGSGAPGRAADVAVEGGVIRDVLLDYGEFRLDATLDKLEMIARPDC